MTDSVEASGLEHQEVHPRQHPHLLQRQGEGRTLQGMTGDEAINMQRFRGGLVFKAHGLCVSLNSRLESNKEEKDEATRLEHQEVHPRQHSHLLQGERR